MKGRKPRPNELKLIEGERPDRVNNDAPRAAQGLPEAPAHLDQVARAEWDRLAAELAALGVLAPSDRAALELYCDTFSLYQKAKNEVLAGGISVHTAAGGSKSAPAIGVIGQCSALMAKLLAEFGATPSARGRVKVANAEGPKDELGEFLSRRKKTS